MLSMQGSQVQSLVRELDPLSHFSCLLKLRPGEPNKTFFFFFLRKNTGCIFLLSLSLLKKAVGSRSRLKREGRGWKDFQNNTVNFYPPSGRYYVYFHFINTGSEA